MQVNNGSYDPNGLDLSMTFAPLAPLYLGINTVTLTFNNGYLSSSCSANVTVLVSREQMAMTAWDGLPGWTLIVVLQD